MACKEIMEYLRKAQERLISSDPLKPLMVTTSTLLIWITCSGATNTTLRSLYKIFKESQKTSITIVVVLEEENN
jgi:glucosamine 6-phosphate synthetase-like amidotransferase/phosphosugar isomerase protein